MRCGWVYIMTNQRNGTLYLGVTSDIARRAWQHRYGAVAGFTKRYRLGCLVWVERHDTVAAAIQREKTMKHWPRAWTLRLIEAAIRSGMTCTTGSRTDRGFAWIAATSAATTEEGLVLAALPPPPTSPAGLFRGSSWIATTRAAMTNGT
jgi:putative endonuclease